MKIDYRYFLLLSENEDTPRDKGTKIHKIEPSRSKRDVWSHYICVVVCCKQFRYIKSKISKIQIASWKLPQYVEEFSSIAFKTVEKAIFYYIFFPDNLPRRLNRRWFRDISD
jgi:hypothetical protein